MHVRQLEAAGEDRTAWLSCGGAPGGQLASPGALPPSTSTPCRETEAQPEHGPLAGRITRDPGYQNNLY